ncbi:hypothetical protein D3C80_1961380 [compost metagenome]
MRLSATGDTGALGKRIGYMLLHLDHSLLIDQRPGSRTFLQTVAWLQTSHCGH